MRQWEYRHLPDRVRRALRPAYYWLRSWQERIWLRWLWQMSRRAPNPSFFPALQNYALSTRAYLQEPCGKNSDALHAYLPIRDETTFEPSSPKTIGYNPLVHLCVPFNPPLFATLLQDVKVYGDAGDVVTSDRVLLADISFRTAARMWHEKSEHPLLQFRSPARTIPVRGTAALLTSLYAGSNYFHWMFNALPRLALLERADIPFDDLNFLANRLHFQVQREMLSVLQIPLERIVEMDLASALQVDSLWVMPSFITTGHRRRWVCDWLRAHFLRETPNPKPSRRLFLSRADAKYRRLANEDEVMEILAPLGFEKIVIGQRSVFEQSALFAQAQVVVAPHTTTLGNLVFCNPGTRVIDFMPTNRLRTYMYELSACMGLDYYYDFAEWNAAPFRAGTNAEDTIIPLDRLRAMLRRIGIA